MNNLALMAAAMVLVAVIACTVFLIVETPKLFKRHKRNTMHMSLDLICSGCNSEITVLPCVFCGWHNFLDNTEEQS